MTEKERYYTKLNLVNHYQIYDSKDKNKRFYPYSKEIVNKLCNELNKLYNENKQLKQLAEGNEESLLTVMTYLHDNHYDIWEKVNKECFND